MSKTPNFDAKIKTILDQTLPGSRQCALTGEAWELTAEELAWCRKFSVPPSTMSPLTRLKLLTSFFVGYQWWNNKDAQTGKPMITSSHPGSGVKVIDDAAWFSQDFSSICRDDHPKQSVLETIHDLQMNIPFTAFRNLVPPINSISTISAGDENSFFMNACKSKNSFFSVNAADTEHSAEVYQSRNISDSYNVLFSERIHNGRYIQHARDCLNVQFLFDCRNCEDCFMATNKRNKRFVFKNEQLTQAEYRQRLSTIDFTSRATVKGLKKEFAALIQKDGVWPENFNESAIDSSGEYLTRTTNCQQCYFNSDCRDQFWCGYGNFDGSEGNAFTVAWFGSSNSYLSSTGSRSSSIKFSFLSVQSQNLEYSIHCYNCEDCFGCVGLQRKRFCIFNKQYSEEAYWQKLDEIKTRMLEHGEYGEFLPARFSPTRFLDSGAALFYLADTDDEQLLKALHYPPESAGAGGEDRLTNSVLRETKDIPDKMDFMNGWIGQAIYDHELERRFVFLPQEIAFYKEMNIAPPNRHFMARVRDLIFQANSGVFETTVCNACKQDVQITKNKTFPDRRVLCKACYRQFLERQS